MILNLYPRPRDATLSAMEDGLRDRVRRLEAELDRLRRVQALGETFQILDLDRLSAAAVKGVAGLLRARRVSLYLLDYGSDELVLAAKTLRRALAKRTSTSPARPTVMSEAARSRTPLRIEGFAARERETGTRLARPFSARYATERCVSVPLLSDQFLVGVLNAADPARGARFDPEDLDALAPLWRALAMSIRNGRLFLNVRDQAHTDALTGLRNSRAFQETMRIELQRAARHRRPLGLILLDVDGFKALNDQRGHPAGDAALAALGEIVRRTMRKEDIPARYGGDEFAIVLPETPPAGGAAVAERLIRAVRAHRFSHDGRRLPVSISAGMAFWRPGMSAARLLRAADAALYRAKRAGKNRFEAAE
jgi:diguanylate cyclase (GGDEF)-like protein